MFELPTCIGFVNGPSFVGCDSNSASPNMRSSLVFSRWHPGHSACSHVFWLRMQRCSTWSTSKSRSSLSHRLHFHSWRMATAFFSAAVSDRRVAPVSVNTWSKWGSFSGIHAASSMRHADASMNSCGPTRHIMTLGDSGSMEMRQNLSSSISRVEHTCSASMKGRPMIMQAGRRNMMMNEVGAAYTRRGGGYVINKSIVTDEITWLFSIC